MERLMVWAEAAEYCGLPVEYFRCQVKQGRGPTRIKVSPKYIVFRQADLNQWMTTWDVRTPTQPA